MPIVTAKPPQTPKPEVTGKAIPLDMKTAVVESRYIDLSVLTSHVAGARVVLEGFFQRLRAEDSPRAQDITLEPAQQSYNRVRNLEARLQGELSQSLDDSSKEWTITGELIMYPGITPQTGDMFRMDLGQGTWGVAHITNASPTSIHPNTPFRCSFQILYQMDEKWFADLEEKTVDVYYFVMDFLRAGKSPLVIDESYDLYRRLDRLFGAMVADYLRIFYSDVNQTLIFPGQPGGAYDPFLVKALQSILSVTDHPILGELSRHAVDVEYAYRTTTVWDALLQVEPSYLYLCSQQVGMIDKGNLKDRGVFGGAYWHQFTKIMFPIDRRRDADVQFSKVKTPMIEPIQDAGVPATDLSRLIVNNVDSVNMELVDEVSQFKVAPEIPEVNKDLYYVFTKAFYEKDKTKLTQLEELVWSVLEQNEIDVPTLYRLVDRSQRWDRLERFYYVPVLMFLCVIVFRGPSHR